MSSTRDKQHLFLGFAIPDKEVEADLHNDCRPWIQTHKFAWKLLRALRYGLGERSIEVVSVRPISDYPLNGRIIVRSRRHEDGVYEAGFINVTWLKHVTRTLTTLWAGLVWMWRTPRPQRESVIVYSVHIPLMIAGLFISKLSGIPLFGVWTDPPGVPLESDGLIIGLMRRIDYHLAKKLMVCFSGCIVLARALASDFAPGMPFMLMEGIADGPNNVPVVEKALDFTYLYAGGLSRANGVDVLVRAFRNLPYKDVSLVLYGKGDVEAEVIAASSYDPRIVYLGQRPNSEVLEAMARAHVLVNPRRVEVGYASYSFPSKLLEYMESGTPVLTTALPGIPEDYFEHVMVLHDTTLEEVEAVLDKVYTMPRGSLFDLGSRSKSFVRNKTAAQQGLKIASFIKNYIKVDGGD